MGRIPWCGKDNVKRGQWTPEEDNKLSSYIAQHGILNCCSYHPEAIQMLFIRLIFQVSKDVGKAAGCDGPITFGPTISMASCRQMLSSKPLLKLHSVVGNAQLPGQTDNDVKTHWNTKLKKFSGMGIDPVIHKPFSHLMAEITSTLGPPQLEMLQLKKKRIDFQFQQSNPTQGNNTTVPCVSVKEVEKDDTVERIKLNLYRAVQEPDMLPMNKPWESTSRRATSANFEAGCVFFLRL
ncbi:hypothetical protein GQ457_07G012230 [Hibiscus cannabinus]